MAHSDRLVITVTPTMKDGKPAKEVELVKWPLIRKEVCETDRELEILLSTAKWALELHGIPGPEVKCRSS